MVGAATSTQNTISLVTSVLAHSLTCRLYLQHLPQGPPLLLLVLAQVPDAVDWDMKANDDDNHMVVKTFGFIMYVSTG